MTIRGGASHARRYVRAAVFSLSIALAWPEDGKLTIETLAQGKAEFPKSVGRVELLGNAGPLPFERQAGGLVVTLPNTKPNEYAYVLKIRPA